MAHNSLYITTREQTQQQLENQEGPLDQIKAYQSTLDSQGKWRGTSHKIYGLKSRCEDNK